MLGVQLLINGIVVGSVYALVAIGFALIYNTTGIFHISHGGVFVWSGYAAFALAVLVGAHPVVTVIGALVLAFALGVGTELLLYNPLRKRGASHGIFFIGSLGLFIVLQNLVSLAFGDQAKIIRQESFPVYRLGEISVNALNIGIVVVCLITFVLLQLFLSRTNTGREIRALANNPELAEVIGINIDRLRVFVLGLGSALAGVSAMLVSIDAGMRPDMGFSAVLYASVAVIVGGVGFLPGAAVGALVLGLAENLGIWQLSTQWQNTIVFGVLILVLLLRPQGIFGRLMRQA